MHAAKGWRLPNAGRWSCFTLCLVAPETIFKSFDWIKFVQLINRHSSRIRLVAQQGDKTAIANVLFQLALLLIAISVLSFAFVPILRQLQVIRFAPNLASFFLLFGLRIMFGGSVDPGGLLLRDLFASPAFDVLLGDAQKIGPAILCESGASWPQRHGSEEYSRAAALPRRCGKLLFFRIWLALAPPEL